MAHSGTLILDSEGLSKLVADDRQVMSLLRGAEEEDMRVVASILTSSHINSPDMAGTPM